MENLELRIQTLEKKYAALKYLMLFLICFSAYTGVATMNTLAIAQTSADGSTTTSASGVTTSADGSTGSAYGASGATTSADGSTTTRASGATTSADGSTTTSASGATTSADGSTTTSESGANGSTDSTSASGATTSADGSTTTSASGANGSTDSTSASGATTSANGSTGSAYGASGATTSMDVEVSEDSDSGNDSSSASSFTRIQVPQQAMNMASTGASDGNSSGGSSQPMNLGQVSQTPEAKAAGVPLVVEAQAFILRDAQGNIRGIWSAEAETTSFAMKHNQNHPMIAMSVDTKNASLSLTDVYGGKINASLNDSIRSMAITDGSGKNNIYLGLTASGESSFDMISTGKSAMTIDGEVSSLDMSGDSSVIALTETVGSTLALKTIPSTTAISFLDHLGKTTMDLTTIDGKTQIKLSTPDLKQENIITSVPQVQVIQAPEEDEEELSLVIEESSSQSGGIPSKKQEEKVDMKSYNPFGKDAG